MRKLNDLQIFSNEEFGQVRTAMNSGEVWFVGKDVAEILGYADPNKAIAMHVDEDDKLNDKSASSLGQRGGWLINESGLYSLILSSKMPNARKFKRWVTSEVLPTIRKTGSYQKPMSQIEMMRIQLGMIDNHEERIAELEQNMTIDYAQQQALGEAVNYVVIDALGGKGSDAYKEIGKKVFSECNRDLKRYFRVNARNNVQKKRFNEAIEYVQHWQPCTNTQIAIKECNSQMRFV